MRKIESHDSNPSKNCIAVFARRCNNRDLDTGKRTKFFYDISERSLLSPRL